MRVYVTLKCVLFCKLNTLIWKQQMELNRQVNIYHFTVFFLFSLFAFFFTFFASTVKSNNLPKTYTVKSDPVFQFKVARGLPS